VRLRRAQQSSQVATFVLAELTRLSVSETRIELIRLKKFYKTDRNAVANSQFNRSNMTAGYSKFQSDSFELPSSAPLLARKIVDFTGLQKKCQTFKFSASSFHQKLTVAIKHLHPLLTFYSHPPTHPPTHPPRPSYSYKN
jgi:hypothetical protein